MTVLFIKPTLHRRETDVLATCIIPGGELDTLVIEGDALSFEDHVLRRIATTMFVQSTAARIRKQARR